MPLPIAARLITIHSPRGYWPRARPSANTMPVTVWLSIPARFCSPPAPARPTASSSGCFATPAARSLRSQPGYPLFDFLAALDDVRLKTASLVYDHGWQIDAEAIRRAITPQTRAIVVVHPNNPTGHFTKPWEAAELARLCHEFDLAAHCGRGVSRLWHWRAGLEFCRGA